MQVNLQFKDDGPVRQEHEMSEASTVHADEYVTVVSALASTKTYPYCKVEI